jgi:hypothetical protein
MHINKNNNYSKMVLNSYFNVLYKSTTERISLNGVNIKLYVIPGLWTQEENLDNRANTIYPIDFQTGDILIYTNTNDKKYEVEANTHNTKENIITYEDGEYAYIYVDGKFVGVNLGND